MRRFLLILLCFMLVCPAALADKTVTLTFTGDVTLGGEEYLRAQPTSFDSVAAEMGYAYFFANFRDFFAEDDLTIVNLEGVIADSGRGEVRNKTYRFRAPTEFLQILKEGNVEVAGLANNHTYDYSKQGYTATLEALAQAEIACFGNQEIYVYEKDGLKIAFLGLNSSAFQGSQEWLKKEIARLKEEEGVNAVVFTAHAGQEYGKHRSPGQEYYSRFAINSGADLVVINHPHVMQGINVYNNRVVCYSLGNFCFGGNKMVRSINSMIARVTMTFSDEGVFLGQQLALYPIHISGTDPQNNYQPCFVTGNEANEVIRLVQVDTDYPINPFSEELGCALQDYVPAEPPAEEEN